MKARMMQWIGMLLCVLSPLFAAEMGLPMEVFSRLQVPVVSKADANAPDWDSMQPGIMYVYFTKSDNKFAGLMKVLKVRSGGLAGLAKGYSKVSIDGRNIRIEHDKTEIIINEDVIWKSVPAKDTPIHGGGKLSEADRETLFEQSRKATSRHEKLHESDNEDYPESTFKVDSCKLQQQGYSNASMTDMMKDAGVSQEELNTLRQYEIDMDILTEARAVREEMSYAYDQIYINMIFGDTWSMWEQVTQNKELDPSVPADIWKTMQNQANTVVPFVQKDGRPMTYGELFKEISKNGQANARQALSDLIIQSRLQSADVKIEGTDVTYAEAYNSYFKDYPALHVWNQSLLFGYTDAKFAELAQLYRKLLSDLWGKTYDHLVKTASSRVIGAQQPVQKTAPISAGTTERLASRRSVPPTRWVCMACLFGDTMGKCSKKKCCNYGRPHKEYKRQKGDKRL